MTKENYCLFPLVAFCLHFCLEDYRIAYGFRCFCYSLIMMIYSQQRYSLCFSSLMVFGWSSMFLFEGSWLMILISLNLTSESLDLNLLRTEWQSEVLHVSPKSHTSPSILSLLFFWVLLLRSLLITSFLEQISVLRNSISFSSVAIILLSTRILYSSLLCRSSFCFISFSINSATSFFISRSRISLIFLYLILFHALTIRSNVSEELLSLFRTLLVTKESISSSIVGDRISEDAPLFI